MARQTRARPALATIVTTRCNRPFAKSLENLVPPAGESLNTIFQELADWEHQLKALEQDIPIEWEEPSP